MDEEQGARRRVTLDALDGYFPDGRWAGRMQPLPEHGCIYVKNAKAGTNTTLLWMHRAYTGDHRFVPTHTIHTDSALPSPRVVGLAKVAAMLDGGAFRFSFVREPIARLESAYMNKIVQADPSADVREGRWRIEIQRTLGLPRDPEQVVPFDQFLAALEVQEPLRMNPHWRPQHLNLLHGLVRYDLIGRLETYREDLARVREATGMPEAPLEVTNASSRGRDSLFAGRPTLLRRARQLYAADFELYGY